MNGSQNLLSGHLKVIAFKTLSSPNPWEQSEQRCLECVHLCFPVGSSVQCGQVLHTDRALKTHSSDLFLTGKTGSD